MKKNRENYTRRDFLIQGSQAAAGLMLLNQLSACSGPKPGSEIRFGLVTYLWGKDWDLETLITNCEAANYPGVELRTTHAHGVERDLNAEQRMEVKKRFQDSAIDWVGIGSNENFDSPDPDKLKMSIEATKDFIKLSHDIGGTGVKVKPNSFHEGVEHEVTIEQIGKSLNTVAQFGADYGQQIRLEVHGQCSKLPIMKSIMDIADHPNVGVCWNSNNEDLAGQGLEYNFNLVKDRFGDTAHIRELNVGDYPYQDLMNLFVKMDYKGWILLEARTAPEDPVAAMKEQLNIFHKMIKNAQQNL
jgi:sugar phosphate isomerase/epimerase